MIGRKRKLVLAVVVVALAAIVVILIDPFGSPSRTERIAGVAPKLLDVDYLSLGLRTSFTDPTGETKFTDSSAQLDLINDRSFVDLPDVLRQDTLVLLSQGKTLFITIPEDMKDTFPGIRWLRVETDSRSKARGAGVGSVPDPVTVMLAMAGATGRAERLESTEIDDVDVDVFRVAVEPERMARRLSGEEVASANMLGSISLSWEAEVSVAADGVPRRLVLRSELVVDGDHAGFLEFDLSIGSIDVPIEIGIPPDDAVRSVDTVLEALRILEAA